jgi:hypothetical protein
MHSYLSYLALATLFPSGLKFDLQCDMPQILYSFFPLGISSLLCPGWRAPLTLLPAKVLPMFEGQSRGLCLSLVFICHSNMLANIWHISLVLPHSAAHASPTLSTTALSLHKCSFPCLISSLDFVKPQEDGEDCFFITLSLRAWIYSYPQKSVSWWAGVGIPATQR